MNQVADVMGASGLAGYAIVALLLFVFAFLLLLYTIVAPSRRKRFERDALLPFDDGTVSSTAQRGTDR